MIDFPQYRRPFLFVLALVAGFGLQLHAQISASAGTTPESVVKVFTADQGLKIRNERFSGNPNALGTFKNTLTESIFESGVILSTGKATDMAHANDAPKTSTYNAKGGDKTLYQIAGGRTFDYAELEFDFMTDKDSLAFSFLFASEEYNEFVGSTFNDAFSIVITGPGMPAGKHFGLIPGTKTPITVNSVNISKNKKFYNDNNPFTLVGRVNEKAKAALDPTILNNFTFDGFTKEIAVGMRIQPRKVYHFKLSIADASDGNIDSAVLLKGESFKSVEQYKHVLRRQMIAEQKRQDSLARVAFVADSLAKIARIAFVADSTAQALARADSLQAALEMVAEEKFPDAETPDAEIGHDGFEPAEKVIVEEDQVVEDVETPPTPTNAFEEIKEVILYEGDGYLLSEQLEEWLHELGNQLAKDPKLRVGIFLVEGDSESSLKMRYDFIRLELVKGGAMTTQIFKNGFSFLSSDEEKPPHRAEIWLRKAD